MAERSDFQEAVFFWVSKKYILSRKKGKNETAGIIFLSC